MERRRHNQGRIILVRHARLDVDPDIPAGTWSLAPGAEEPVRLLASRLGVPGVDGVVTSPETKAVATAQIIAGEL